MKLTQVNTNHTPALRLNPPSPLVIPASLTTFCLLMLGTPALVQAQATFIPNAPTNPVWVRDVDGHKDPFMGEASFAAGGPGFSSNVILYSSSQYGGPVPAGKRLVIEYVSGYAQVEKGRPILVSLYTTADPAGARGEHFFAPILQGTDSSTDYWSFSQATRLYAGPGTMVIANWRVPGPGGPHNKAGLLDIHLSGYYEDLPVVVMQKLPMPAR